MFSSNRCLVRLAVEPRIPSVALPKLKIVTARAVLGVADDVGATVLDVPPSLASVISAAGYFAAACGCQAIGAGPHRCNRGTGIFGHARPSRAAATSHCGTSDRSSFRIWTRCVPDLKFGFRLSCKRPYASERHEYRYNILILLDYFTNFGIFG
jgi:hypothetical protein